MPGITRGGLAGLLGGSTLVTPRASSEPNRLAALKREIVPLLGGTFCVGKGRLDCENCEYDFPSAEVVFHNASYEYPDEGDYRCTDCFISWATAAPMTRSMEDEMDAAVDEAMGRDEGQGGDDADT